MLGTIAGIFSAIKAVFDAASAITRFIDANKTETWFQNSADILNKIKEAKTDEERKALAHDLRDLIRRL